MLDRRDLVRIGGALMLAPALPALLREPARAQGAPRLRFGVVADPQYAPVPPRRTRFYANSLWKLSEAIAAFDREELAFVTTLGDIIDRHWGSFGDIMPLYARSRHPTHFILGNHDYEVGGDYLHAVEEAVGRKEGHYAFSVPGWRFLVVDGNDVSLFANAPGSEKHAEAEARLAALKAAGAPNAQSWNGGMSEAQKAWMRSELAAAEAAGERVLIFGHYPAHPVDPHNMWDDAEFVETVTGSPNVVAYFNGHNHAGGYGRAGGAHFVTFKGMVETADTTAFAIVEIFDDKLEIRGFGREESRTLPI